MLVSREGFSCELRLLFEIRSFSSGGESDIHHLVSPQALAFPLTSLFSKLDITSTYARRRRDYCWRSQAAYRLLASFLPNYLSR